MGKNKKLSELEERRSIIKLYNKTIGPCPYCGSKKHWYNDVPLRAFCFGSIKKPHKEWHKKLPKKLQPYQETI